ncbi:MAG: DUF3179 domain-containing protein [Myxococcales bacterium]|nr:DUF3179 domain-containing protein [Myxococcales bacterium]
MACNTGVSSAPIIDGTTYDFRVAALFNGLALMEDVQTRSYWDHVTGEAIHGQLRGAQLPDVAPLQYMPAHAAAKRYPQAELALSTPSVRQRVIHRVFLRRMLRDEGHLPFLFAPSMAKDDPRRPRMELGLGVWWPGLSRFYPMPALRELGGAVVDTLSDRRLLVFIDPESHAPVAAHTEAHGCRWQGQTLELDDGSVVESLERVDAQGIRRPLELLPQLFTRWYGFSATFPGCEVFEP